MTISDYIVIKAQDDGLDSSLRKLTTFVKQRIEAGWQPIGGVWIERVGGNISGHTTISLQAMVR
jgi:hypothetical protein